MLHDHDEMIELNPLVIEHHPVKTPRDAPKDEFLDCAWHEMTDRISYLPGGMVKGKVTYKGCFHDIPNGLQTHIYAPMSLDIREKWTVCGTLPGEPEEARELGLNTPRRGLYLREDGEMKCNMLMSSFVRKNLDNSHKVLVERILAKAERVQTQINYSSTNASETSSIRGGANNIPAFQPGSHMGNSKLARQMSGTPRSTPTSPFRPEPGRFSSESAAVQAARSQLSGRDHHNLIQELPVTQPGNTEGSIQPRSLTDQDPPELHGVHPALRDQYRQGMSQSTPAVDGSSRHAPTSGKNFAVELEGSRPETSSSKHSNASTTRRTNAPVEMDGGYSGHPSHNDFSAASFRSRNNVNGSASATSTSTENERHGRSILPSLTHMRSYSQPMIEANTYIDSASSAHNMEPSSSIISTHPHAGGRLRQDRNRDPGHGESNSAGSGRFRGLSNSGTWPQPQPQPGYTEEKNAHTQINDDTFAISMPHERPSKDYDVSYLAANNTHNHNQNQTYDQGQGQGQEQNHDPNDPSRFSMVSEISDMPTPKADRFAFGTGAVDNRYSVVSAMTDGVPTPRMNSSGGFAEQQRQHLEQAGRQKEVDRLREREREWEMQRRNFI